ncbi:MAG: flagellar capping protein [Lachnospiraceae bacterium]|nr:flagellar capping protein [Lachnospiraceae bacterium]
MINSVYNYYLSTYAGKQLTKYDSHKKSDLKDIYNNIVNISKKSPLYFIDNTEEVHKRAIDLKETARDLKNVVAAFNSSIDQNGIYGRKIAASDNEDVLDVKYISDNEEPSTPALEIKVNKLASPQINTGEYLPDTVCKLPAGSYTFDMRIASNTYEFQFNINKEDTNTDIQKKIARLFNRSGIGVDANIIGSPSGNKALEIRSQATGVVEFTGETFTISPGKDESSQKLIKYFGLDNITNMPENASFNINGLDETSSTNTFTVNKEFEITLKDVTSFEDDPVHISFKQDVETLIDSTSELTDGYNNILALVKDKDNSYESNKLANEIQSIIKRNRSELESCGIKINDDGYLSIDKAVMSQAAEEDGIESIYRSLADFKDNILNKANHISIDPMNFVNKTLISYPNPVRQYANPYVTSIYTGMMYNGYV